MSSTGLSGALWRKSSYSNGQANCVEVATSGGLRSLVAVRDSKATGGPSLIFSRRTWRQFTDTMKPCGRRVIRRETLGARRSAHDAEAP